MVSEFEKVLKDNFGYSLSGYCHKYSDIGRTYQIDDKNFKGIYWFYETDEYIIDISDLYVKRDVVINTDYILQNYLYNCVYILTGDGEWFDPYQSLSSNTVIFINNHKEVAHYLLYGNRPFISVSIRFKKDMLNNRGNCNMYRVFFEMKEKFSKDLFKIANEIMHCHMEKDDAKNFMDKKAREWLDVMKKICIDNYRASMSADDEMGIINVGRYIAENYNKQITQKLLEQIAMMSGTKLKTKFKEKFNMSITEYIQRKRINVAESLILNTKMSMSKISEYVGYTSNSRFSLLFKRYKGLKPTQIREIRGKTGCNGCPIFHHECEGVKNGNSKKY